MNAFQEVLLDTALEEYKLMDRHVPYSLLLDYLREKTIMDDGREGGPMLMFYMALIDDKEDQCRFERIYYSYRKQMVLVADRVLHNQSDAEDAVQDALVRIARNIANVPRDEKVERAYVLTAAKNAALNMLPAQQRRREMLDLADVQAAGTDDLFRQVQNCRDYELLLRSIRQMDAPYREVLMLVYVQEQTPKAAADVLGRPYETLRKQLQRGKRLLIELCRKEGLCYVEDRMDAI